MGKPDKPKVVEATQLELQWPKELARTLSRELGDMEEKAVKQIIKGLTVLRMPAGDVATIAAILIERNRSIEFLFERWNK